MIAILLKTLPFFALIGLGYWAGRVRFFTPEATGWLTKFVFYFALSAMLFRFASNLSLAEIWDGRFVAAYLWGCGVVYAIAMGAAFWRGISVEEAAIEAQCAVIGNTGFLGVPMLVVLMGPQAAGPILMVLSIDLIVFSTVVTLIITGVRQGRMSLGIIKALAIGLLKNPMIVSMALGLAWSATGFAVPTPINDFMALLGGAATPGALFAIGASLATKSAERVEIAGWLSFCKLVLHPSAVAFAAIYLFRVDPGPASVMIAAAALPVAGNVYILAQHFGVAPHRVSASILISTALSILTVTIVMALVTG
ncbi:AEC family transporter [Pseudorhodobacter sp. W20_MBD10_FR17]|uniref:AEC family transporter n=1 Tax=Pseudorhodobacter sp. W20_MBD10_FR17 TaxID=3240266 RepID=UPI003F9B53EA